MCVCSHHCIIFNKSSRRTSSLNLPFQSLNSNTRVGQERCSRFIKVTTKKKVNCCSTRDRFEKTLQLVWVFSWPFFKKQLNVQCSIGSISMEIASHIHNATNQEQLPKLLQKIRGSIFHKITGCDKYLLKNLCLYFLPL